MTNMTSPLIILDRDGTINIRKIDGYVMSIENVSIPYSLTKTLIQSLIKHRFLNFAFVTNQSCIGKGLITYEQSELVTEFAIKKFLNGNQSFNYNIYICPHIKEDNCSCRKPRTKLLEKAIIDFNADIINTWFIGDSDSDKEAADSLDIQFLQVCLNPDLCSIKHCFHDPISAILNILNSKM